MDQGAYIESLNRCLRNECLNEHRHSLLLHTRTEIETWRLEYHKEQLKKIPGGLTPTA